MKVTSHRTDELSLFDPHTSPIHVHHPKPNIHRLPVELLQQIFLLAVDDVRDCPYIFSYDYTTVSGNFASPPLIFTRVCHLWRAVAQSTTGIWSRIKVSLIGGDEPSSESFLPCLLQRWLALSGSQPLTIHLEQSKTPLTSQTDIMLLDILRSESRRWETLMFSGLMKVKCLSCNFDTPQLRTLKCAWSDVARFNAPNLHRLYIARWFYDLCPIPTCKNIRHLRLSGASPQIIRSTSMVFPLLETIAVDRLSYSRGRNYSFKHSCLESITLPLSLDAVHQHLFIEIFRVNGVHLPKLQKLILVGHMGKSDVDLVTGALAGTSCNVQVVDFHTNTPQDEVVDIAESLLSVVREVSLHGKVLCCRAPRN